MKGRDARESRQTLQNLIPHSFYLHCANGHRLGRGVVECEAIARVEHKKELMHSERERERERDREREIQHTLLQRERREREIEHT